MAASQVERTIRYFPFDNPIDDDLKKLVETGLNIRAVNLNDMGRALLISALGSLGENLRHWSES